MHMFSNKRRPICNDLKTQHKLTLKIIRLAIHEDVVDENKTEDTGPQVQITE